MKTSERDLQRIREWCNTHRERVRENHRKYEKTHREQRAEYGRKYYQKNRERCNEATRRYRQSHPEKASEYQHRSYQRHRKQRCEAARRYRQAHRKPDACRDVRYTRGWRKDAVRCGQCGFWFVPDTHNYPLYDGEPMEYLTGIQWFEQFKCCPNCLPPEPTAPFGKRRCKCGIFFAMKGNGDARQEKWNGCRRRLCERHMPTKAKAQADKTIALAFKNGIRLSQKLKRSPTYTEWRELHMRPSTTIIAKHFGSWGTFIAAIGLQPNVKGNWRIIKKSNYKTPELYPVDTILEALRKVALQYGRALSVKEWTEAGLKPNPTVVQRKLGGWRKAWLLIGIKPLSSFAENTPDGQRSRELGWLASGTHPNLGVISPTARDMWLASHGQASESTQRYLDAVDYHKAKLDEQDRIFKEHQFKSRDDTDSG